MRRFRALILLAVLVLSSCALVAMPTSWGAQTASTELRLRVDVEELETSVGVGSRTSRLQHLIDFSAEYANGTAASQADRVYSETASIDSGTPRQLDLRGTLTSVLTGDTINFAEVVLVCVHNKSTTSGETLTIGAGSNPWITWLGASGDSVVIGPGGLLCVSSPVDGWATTASTGDILTITSSAAGGISTDILILGRSS